MNFQDKLSELERDFEETEAKMADPAFHSNMKELRVQCKGSPWRILFAFDPDRKAILLVGGDKTGDERFYKTNIPIADARFDKHLEELKEAKRKLKKEYGK